MSGTKTLLDPSLRRAAMQELEAKSLEAKNIADAFPVEDNGGFAISPEQAASYRTAVAAAREAKSFLDALDEQENIHQFLNGSQGKSHAAGHFGNPNALDASDYGDLGSAFVESKAYQKLTEIGGRGIDDIGRLRVEVEGKSLYNFSAGTYTAQSFGTAQDVGIVERAVRKWHVRDLFPKSTTKAPILYGIRETGWVNNADQIPQRVNADGTYPPDGSATNKWAPAPESNLTFEPVTYPVAEIAHHLNAHKNVLSDEPRLKTFINTRLVDGLKYKEDFDLLHSVGGGEKITGLFNVPGVQAYTGLATDGYSVQVRRAITKALLAEYEPNGLVVSPTMFEYLEVEQDAMGQFRVAINVAVGARKIIWRLNVVETTAMSDVNFLLGSFGMACQLHDRENVSVTVSTEHGTNFVDGAVTFRCDERLALEVPRPEAVVVGTWTTPTA